MVEQLQLAFILACAVSLILTIWFKTDAFVEYFCFLPTCRKYQDFKKTTGLHYTDFIVFNKNTFLRRLISCPYCVGFWLTLPCICVLPFIYVPVIYMVSQILYKQI